MLWLNQYSDLLLHQVLLYSLILSSLSLVSHMKKRKKLKNALAKCVQIVKCQLNVIFQVWYSNKALWKLVVICWELKEKIFGKVLRGFISGDFEGLTGADCFPTHAIPPDVLQCCCLPSFHVFDCVICWPRNAPSLIQRWPFFRDDMQVTLLWSCLVSSATQSFPCLQSNIVWTLCQLALV